MGLQVELSELVGGPLRRHHGRVDGDSFVQGLAHGSLIVIVLGHHHPVRSLLHDFLEALLQVLLLDLLKRPPPIAKHALQLHDWHLGRNQALMLLFHGGNRATSIDGPVEHLPHDAATVLALEVFDSAEGLHCCVSGGPATIVREAGRTTGASLAHQIECADIVLREYAIVVLVEIVDGGSLLIVVLS